MKTEIKEKPQIYDRIFLTPLPDLKIEMPVGKILLQFPNEKETEMNSSLFLGKDAKSILSPGDRLFARIVAVNNAEMNYFKGDYVVVTAQGKPVLFNREFYEIIGTHQVDIKLLKEEGE